MKYVYSFLEGNKDMRETLGGKGANLAEMTHLGLPVPKGFTITTDACLNYYNSKGSIKSEIVNEIINHIKKLEEETKKTFGHGPNPLLLSIRSGSPVSMPGMMDTILNLGMSEEVAEILITKTNNPRFVYDSYRRFIMMYADVVKGFDRSIFENKLTEYKKTKNVTKDLELDQDDLKKLTIEYLNIYQSLAHKPFPTDPYRQLLEAVSAVFRSWNNERAIYYRKINNISDSLGTAVNVQEMVYGNISENSGTGVAFTRNPSNGIDGLFGEYLMNAQGEDLVAGIRTPHPIAELQMQMPEIYNQFFAYAKVLESHYKDMQDIEFTIEEGKLYILQTRNGKRTSLASLKIAVDLVEEKLITKEEAILRIKPEELENILHPSLNVEGHLPIVRGLGASPGAATGKIFFNSKDVLKAQEENIDVILVRNETSPEDIEGMNHAKGILTVRGGITSHAAVVARGMGRCCVSGCENIYVDEIKKEIHFPDGTILKEKDDISLNGTTGEVYLGILPLQQEKENTILNKFLLWTDEISNIKVRANADTKNDAILAKNLGANGIGLCRTEHMFFQSERILAFRKVILAETQKERVTYLNELLPYQRQDFYELFQTMENLPIIIRYLDPPLHEFLPKTESEKIELANTLGLTLDQMEERISKLKEFNPMMGHRGCRLSVTYPEIAVMQTKAIMEAIILLMQEGKNITPEIMIPLTIDIKEFNYIKKIVDDTAIKIMKEHNVTIHYQIGTMIETPRSCILADEIASSAEFFSFGTNDLTQLTYGFSRDDANKFLPTYLEKEILKKDPFKSIDQNGVGSLMKVAIEIAKNINPNISLGICGEHAADKDSIFFCSDIGLDYVSCSPYRIPVAKLIAAQAAIKNGGNK